ncbi:hypothetical protein HKCCE4037_06820 [Rhodobacterales bacterium HKCCE4037]|nr:hypothetical protein [Rhodobacterales bacterium HKCCE4037]
MSVLSAIAAFVLILFPGLAAPEQRARRRKRTRRAERRLPPVVIDGSNVMHWKDETPSLDTVKEVIAALADLGFRPGIIFDANVGYKLEGRYLDDSHLARRLNLPADRTLVVPKGEPADPTILAAARDMGARIVTNDRFREWIAEFPEIAETGTLVRGGYVNGHLWLDEAALGAPTDAESSTTGG